MKGPRANLCFALGFLCIFAQFFHGNMCIIKRWYFEPPTDFHILYPCRILSNAVERLSLQTLITLWIMGV